MTNWFIVLLISIVAHKILAWLNYQRLLRKYGAKDFTNKPFLGPLGLGFLYNAFKVRRLERFVDSTYEGFKRLKNPEVPTFKINLLGNDVVLTCDPENVKAVLATQFNDFGIGPRHAILSPLLGNGIFTSSGEHWKHSRAMLRPQFAREQIGHVQMLEPHFQLLKKHVLNAKGQKFNLQALIYLFTIDAATEFLFGESIHSLHDESVGMALNKQSDAGKVIFAGAFQISQQYIATRALLQKNCWLVNPKKFREANKVMHDFADIYVRKALSYTPEEIEKGSQEGYVFLYELVKKTRDPIMIRDQLFNILLAGRNTTASFLSFTFFELARNPEIYEKLKAEVRSTFGHGDDIRIEDITFESLKRCEYMKAVLNELLRVYPTVPVNMRVPVRDTTLPRGGGPDGQSPVFVRKGTTVSFSVYSLHRNKQIYGEDSEVFRPERWFEPQMKGLGWAYAPFGGGPRICIGQQFALTEASYLTCRLAQEFDHLESFDTEYPPRKGSQVTMKLTQGCNVAMY